MRRATTFVLASGLAAAVLAGALLYHGDSLPVATEVRAGQTQSAPRQQASTAATEPAVGVELDASHPKSNEAVAHDEHRPNSPDDSRGIARYGRERDEATARADMRKHATQEVRDSYALLLEDLTLTPEEKNDLVALLIEMQIEGMWTRGSTWEIRGREIPDQERYERIAAVIGDQKLLAFLELEQNRQAYWETTQIARLLRRRSMPLTETQRDGVFDILVEVGARYPHTPAPADIDDNSVEWIEHVLTQYDEHDRHVIELAPTALSPNQVVRLFEQYQSMSRQRVDSVARYKRLKDERPGQFRGWGYSPGSWDY